MRNPLVWLRRFRKRRGYGVHSPWAYELITNVIYSPGTYYAYRDIDRRLTLADRILRPRLRAKERLRFRLRNRFGTVVSLQPGQSVDLSAAPHGSIVMLDRLRKNKQQWASLRQHPRATVTFDLHDVGLAALDQAAMPAHYVINW